MFLILYSIFEQGNKSANLAALEGMPWSGPPVATALEGLVSEIQNKKINHWAPVGGGMVNCHLASVMPYWEHGITIHLFFNHRSTSACMCLFVCVCVCMCVGPNSSKAIGLIQFIFVGMMNKDARMVLIYFT